MNYIFSKYLKLFLKDFGIILEVNFEYYPRFSEHVNYKKLKKIDENTNINKIIILNKII